MLSCDSQEDSYDSKGFDFDFKRYLQYMYKQNLHFYQGTAIFATEKAILISSRNVHMSEKSPGQCLKYILMSILQE